MRTIATWMAAGALLCAGAVTAGAQTPPNAAPDQNSRSQQAQPQAPDQGRHAPPQEGSSAAPEGSLSHDLSRSRGTIAPPPTGDTQMAHPPPAPGPQSTPVIPPPGSPGGNQKVEPK